MSAGSVAHAVTVTAAVGTKPSPVKTSGGLTRGFTRDGGYATHMLADASALAHVPADLDDVESAPLMCAGVTTFNALRNAGARPGEVVAIPAWAASGISPCSSPRDRVFALLR